jgi:hypothetical protein
MNEEFVKIFGILIVSFFIIYVVLKIMHPPNMEGMTTNDSSAGGEAGTAASYAGAIKANVVKLQDELLVAKYRKEYESVIINLDDYIGYIMLKQALNLKTTDDVKTNIQLLNNLNILKQAKDSLNTTMAFLDKQ